MILRCERVKNIKAMESIGGDRKSTNLNGEMNKTGINNIKSHYYSARVSAVIVKSALQSNVKAFQRKYIALRLRA